MHRRRPFQTVILCFLLGCCLSWQLPAISTPASITTQQAAQTLNAQGQMHLEQGNPGAALANWQRAEQQYRQAGDAIGIIGSQLNQAKALQALGFYRRAQTLLTSLQAALQQQPDSLLQANYWLTLGNVLRVVGDFAAAQTALEQSLAIAQHLQSPPDIQVAWFHLGNLQLAQQQFATALRSFRQAATLDNPLRVIAQLRQFTVLLALNRRSEAIALLPSLQTQLAQLPVSQTAIYGRIELATQLMTMPVGPDQSIEQVTNAAELLATAAAQAKTLSDRRAESYAIGRLGYLYERTRQWREAAQLTDRALLLAELSNASDIAYQWQWQRGRLLNIRGDKAEAIAAYTQAVNTLRSLRQDLVAIHQDIQFSFREQVEPVYRQLVELLLTPTSTGEIPQANLKQARQVIESLQLAELNNFFREACLDTQPQPIDQLDPTAAVIYPIILPDRLEVILSLPGKPLRHYATTIPADEMEAVIQQMRRSLRVTSFLQERRGVAQQLYRWLIQPAIADLERQQIKTLVFVLDGSLRNVPIAALHDGTHYLIEHYRVAVTPSLQLFPSHPAASQHFKLLIGGLSEATQEFQALPGVKQEVTQISTALPAIVLLDQQFTTAAVKTKASQAAVSIIHFATHGQFSSNPEDTFLVTWNGRIDVTTLNTLLAERDLEVLAPIDLLVLSACQTAQGDNRATLGLAGFAVRSGARSTLATLWKVNDRSTAEFMQAFYQALKQPGMTKAAAVQQAQLQLLQRSEFSHPYYWAPFILVGSWL